MRCGTIVRAEFKQSSIYGHMSALPTCVRASKNCKLAWSDTHFAIVTELVIHRNGWGVNLALCISDHYKNALYCYVTMIVNHNIHTASNIMHILSFIHQSVWIIDVHMMLNVYVLIWIACRECMHAAAVQVWPLRGLHPRLISIFAKQMIFWSIAGPLEGGEKTIIGDIHMSFHIMSTSISLW